MTDEKKLAPPFTLFALQASRAQGTDVTLTSAQAAEVLTVLGNLGGQVSSAEILLSALVELPDFESLPVHFREAVGEWRESVARRKQRAMEAAAGVGFDPNSKPH